MRRKKSVQNCEINGTNDFLNVDFGTFVIVQKIMIFKIKNLKSIL